MTDFYTSDVDSYWGHVQNNSKVLVHESCKVFINNEFKENKTFKKFIVDSNSQVTWINTYDKALRLAQE